MNQDPFADDDVTMVVDLTRLPPPVPASGAATVVDTSPGPAHAASSERWWVDVEPPPYPGPTATAVAPSPVGPPASPPPPITNAAPTASAAVGVDPRLRSQLRNMQRLAAALERQGFVVMDVTTSSLRAQRCAARRPAAVQAALLSCLVVPWLVDRAKSRRRALDFAVYVMTTPDGGSTLVVDGDERGYEHLRAALGDL